MKKKLIALLLVVALCLVFFAGCDEIFKKNDYREQAQVVATVSYTGDTGVQSSVITKGELASTFNQYAAQYNYYYGMTYEQCADYLLGTLTSRELLVLWAKDLLAGQKGLTASTCTLDQLLTSAEIDKAVRATNTDMLSALKSIVTDLIEEDSWEDEANADDDDDEEEEETETVESPYPAIRATRTEAEEDEDADYDADDNTVVVSKKFFDAEYISALTADDFDEGEQALTYVSKAVAELKTNLAKIYRDYDYYLQSQYKTVILDRFKTMVHEGVPGKFEGVAEPTDDEIDTYYNRQVDLNKEAFAKQQSSYASSLTSALSTTFFAPEAYRDIAAGEGYGFVQNILIKWSKAQVKEYKDLLYAGTSTTEQLTAYRDALAQSTVVYISNHDYDATYKCEDNTCGKDTCDPMLCEDHVCAATETNDVDSFNHILTFTCDETEVGSGIYEPKVTYGLTACPAMPFIKTSHPAFDTAEKVGVVTQIYNSLKAVDDAYAAGKLTFNQKIYWIREVATCWQYLIGDDSGSTNSESNNGGLGYQITPEGETSSYVTDFTDHTRALVKLGSGSYTTDGTVDGSYCIGASVSTSAQAVSDSDYVGIFFTVISCVPHDSVTYGEYSDDYAPDLGAYPTDGTLPYDYILTFAADEDDCKTVKEYIKDALFTAKKSDYYTSVVNAFGETYGGDKGVVTYKDVYKSIYEDLD